jgi:hypothetical protein
MDLMDEEALDVLRILIEDHECEAEVPIQGAMAQSWFVAAGLEEEDYLPACEAAGDRGWLETRPDGTMVITEAGFAAATADDAADGEDQEEKGEDED